MIVPASCSLVDTNIRRLVDPPRRQDVLLTAGDIVLALLGREDVIAWHLSGGLPTLGSH
jgi:hypothetical protein